MQNQNQKNQIKNLFIANPNAGMKQVANNLPKILDMFTENGDINSVHLTEAQGDAARLAGDLADPASFDRLICIGGDGTFNEVVTGLLLSGSGHDIPIGYIPAGTANDLAASLKLSKNMMQAAKDIICCSAADNIYLDIGRFNGRYFAYVASFGAFTKAAYNTPQASKNMLGHFAYILEGIKEIPAIRPYYIKIETPGTTVEGEYIFGAVSNSKSIGGVLALDPAVVDMSDGLFEVFLIKPLKNMQAVWDCIAALINQNYNSEHITFFTAASAVIFADPGMSWTLDGEYAAGQEKTGIENLCRSVKIIAKQS